MSTADLSLHSLPATAPIEVKNTFIEFSMPASPVVRGAASCHVPIAAEGCSDDTRPDDTPVSLFGGLASQSIKSSSSIVSLADFGQVPSVEDGRDPKFDSGNETEIVLAELGALMERTEHQLATAEAALVAAKEAVAAVQMRHQVLLRLWQKKGTIDRNKFQSESRDASAANLDESRFIDGKGSNQSVHSVETFLPLFDDTDGGYLGSNGCDSQHRIARRKRAPKPREVERGASSKTPGILFHSRFNVGIEADEDFNVMRRLVGTGGKNMKHIIGRSGGKVWIQGKGSRHPEGDQRVESTDPLMIIVTARSTRSFQVATEMVTELLKRLHDDYIKFCTDRGWFAPKLTIRQEIQRGPK